MKEYAGNACNIMLAARDDGSYSARVETVLLLSEVTYISTADGVVRQRKLSDIRMILSSAGLRELAGQLVEYAEAAEKLEANTMARDAAP